MRLLLHPPEQAPRVYWVTRQQWLALLLRVRNVAQKIGLSLNPPKTPDAPRARVARDPALAELTPLKLAAIRCNPAADGAQLLLVLDGKAQSVQLNAAGLKQFEQMLQLQAERAGWDPQAALQRLQAAALAKAAMGRASGLDRPGQ